MSANNNTGLSPTC